MCERVEDFELRRDQRGGWLGRWGCMVVVVRKEERLSAVGT